MLMARQQNPPCRRKTNRRLVEDTRVSGLTNFDHCLENTDLVGIQTEPWQTHSLSWRSRKGCVLCGKRIHFCVIRTQFFLKHEVWSSISKAIHHFRMELSLLVRNSHTRVQQSQTLCPLVCSLHYMCIPSFPRWLKNLYFSCEYHLAILDTHRLSAWTACPVNFTFSRIQ